MPTFKDRWIQAKKDFETKLNRARPKKSKIVKIPIFGKITTTTGSGVQPALAKLDEAMKKAVKKAVAAVETVHASYVTIVDAELQAFFNQKKEMKTNLEKLEKQKTTLVEKIKPKDANAEKMQKDSIRAIKREISEANNELDMFELEMKNSIRPAFVALRLAVSNMLNEAETWMNQQDKRKAITPKKVTIKG